MQEMIELCLKRINDLEKRLEKYYQLLKVENELDFILKGTYFLKEEIEQVMSGNYE